MSAWCECLRISVLVLFCLTLSLLPRSTMFADSKERTLWVEEEGGGGLSYFTSEFLCVKKHH